MYMKTENSKQTVHNGFGQFPKIVQLRTRHSRHYLQFHILSFSLANDCPNISLSLLKDNATSRNPALPSGQKQCNVLHSSPASGVPFSFSFLLYFSRRNSVYFSTSLHKLKSQQLTTKLHTAKPTYQSLCNTCNPVQSEMSIHTESLNTSNMFTSPH